MKKIRSRQTTRSSQRRKKTLLSNNIINSSLPKPNKVYYRIVIKPIDIINCSNSQ